MSHCSSVDFQVMGKVPTISINKTDGCHVYLSKDSLSCEIISAKSSEMNVLVPNKDGEYVSNSESSMIIKIIRIGIIAFLFLFYSRLRSQSLNNSKPYGMVASWSPQQPKLQDKGPACARPPPLQCPTWLTNELKLQSRMECQPGPLSYQPIAAAIISSFS